jgi:hypothetical protein
MANAITEAANGQKTLKAAFEDFARSFLQEMEKMIMKQLILNALQSVGSYFGGGGNAIADAQGGVHYAASGLAGVTSVSSPTYFPRFNVVAGEAGREMLTVLAKPRFMELGGIEAVVGQAGRNTLAITNANDLARGGAGGHVVIEIRHSDTAEARIVSSSIKGAILQVTKEAQQSGPLRKALKTVTK